MKVFNTVVKTAVAPAAVAGAVYVAATYGDKIVDWCKKTLRALSSYKSCMYSDAPVADEADLDADLAVDMVPVEEEAPVEEVPAGEGAVVADEADFEG